MTNLQLLQQKIQPLTKLQALLTLYRKQNKSIVFSNGCFDILHRGHLEYLCAAKDEGDALVIGLNSDESVKRLNKGPERPINNENSRALILAGLEIIDFIVIFNEDTPFELIDALKPNVLIKGGDYDAKESNKQSKNYIIGKDIVESAGGRVKTINLTDGFSTTNIVKKIKNDN